MALNINIEDMGEATKTEKKVLQPGAYEFTIAHAEEGETRAGDPKVTLTLEIEHEGTTHKLSYVTVSFGDKAKNIARQFMDTINVTKITSADELIGKTGWTSTELSEEGWPRQKWWGKPFKQANNSVAATNTPTTTDSIPF